MLTFFGLDRSIVEKKLKENKDKLRVAAVDLYEHLTMASKIRSTNDNSAHRNPKG